MSTELLAESNFKNLAKNPYPGRGIIIGLDETCKNMVFAYWIMGRSENSRNRIFVHEKETGRLFTEPADPSKVKDSSLTIYDAMLEESGHDGLIHVVSNGGQTNKVVEDYRNGKGFHHTMLGCSYEPDEPHFTSRITAVGSWWREKPSAMMCVLRKARLGVACERDFHEIDGFSRLKFEPGSGHCVTTYSGDGNPLPSFRGSPYPVPLRGSIQMIADTYWNNLNPENRVALAVKLVPKQGSPSMTIINRFKKNK